MSEINHERLIQIVAAAEKLVRCKGRYHSEQNYRALAALFGVTTPDLPPLESDVMRERAEPVAYADPQAFRNFQAGTATKEWVWAKPDAGLVPVFVEAPPAPVVPDAIPETESKDGNDIDYMEPSAIYELGKTHGWNACRAAMLGAALGKEG